MKSSLKNASQTGFATMLMVLVMGVATAAFVLARVNYARNAQDIVAMLKQNASTQATAWKATDALRATLGEMQAGYVAQLSVGDVIPIYMSGQVAHKIFAQVIKNIVLENENELTVRIVAKNTTEEDTSISSSALIATFRIRLNPCSNDANCANPQKKPTIMIRGNLDTSGADLRFLGIDGASLFVDGNVNFGATIDLAELCATGDIVVGSTSSFDRVCSDGHLTVNDHASVKAAYVAGDVSMNSAGTIQSLVSNGDIFVTNGNIGYSESVGNVEVSQFGRVAVARTEGTVNWTSRRSASSLFSNRDIEAYDGVGEDTVLSSLGTVSVRGTVKDINAMGDVVLAPTDRGFGITGNMLTNGNFRYTPGLSFVQRGEVSGLITPPLVRALVPVVNIVNISNASLLNLNRVSAPIVQNTSFDFDIVDTNFLRNQANYIFTANSEGKIFVTVQNVSGIASGEYQLGVYRSTADSLYKENQLCTQTSVENVNGSRIPVCQHPTNIQLAKAICVSVRNTVPCISYTASTKTWIIKDAVLPYGAMWFDGDLILEQGNYINSFMATGNISALGRSKLSSPNASLFACSDPTSLNANTTKIAGLLPTNFCDSLTRALILPTKALGNAVLIAGAFSGTQFSGGNITLEVSQEIFGNVFAGDDIQISRSSSNLLNDVVTFHGRIGAFGQGGRQLINVFRLAINFVFDDLPPTTFDINSSPCMSSLCGVTGLASERQPKSVGSGVKAISSSSETECQLSLGCTAGSVSQVRVYWVAYD